MPCAKTFAITVRPAPKGFSSRLSAMRVQLGERRKSSGCLASATHMGAVWQSRVPPCSPSALPVVLASEKPLTLARRPRLLLLATAVHTRISSKNSMCLLGTLALSVSIWMLLLLLPLIEDNVSSSIVGKWEGFCCFRRCPFDAFRDCPVIVVGDFGGCLR